MAVIGSNTQTGPTVMSTATPANVSSWAARPDAHFTRRACARIIDTAIVAAALVGSGVPLKFSVGWVVLGTALTLLYFVALTMSGATIGKRLFGLRVVSTTTLQRPTFTQALRREAGTASGSVPFMGPVVFVGFWIAIVVSVRRDRHGVGLNDRLAPGTQVVAANPIGA
jgi:uncharacterized RDD family membrane protein YckC